MTRRLHAESLEDRRLLAVGLGYHNSIIPEDVTGDYRVSPIDALVVITELNEGGSRDLTSEAVPSGMAKVDTNGDSRLSPVDALIVIHTLNDAEGDPDSNDVMAIDLEVLDANGDPLAGSRVMDGETFQLRVTVQDIRNGGTGVWSAYLDVGYSNDLASTDYAVDPDTLTELFTVADTDPSTFLTPDAFRDAFTRGAQFPNGQDTASPWRWGTSAAYDSADGNFDEDELDEIGAFGPVSLPELGNDVYTLMQGVMQGALGSFDDPGTITFQANPAETGDLLFINSVEMGQEEGVDPNFVYFGTTQVTVYKPVYARDDVVAATEDTDAIIDFTDNDELDAGWLAENPSAVMSLDSFLQPSHGTVVFDAASGNFIYTPDTDYNESMAPTDSFTYTMMTQATDGTIYSDSATVTITVAAVNDDPIAVDDNATVDEDSDPATSPANIIDVVVNDKPGPDTATDEVGQVLTIVAAGTDTTSAAGGTVVVNTTTNRIEYTPPVDFNGSDSFDYTVSDGAGGTDVGTVTITVNDVNDAPIANDDTFGVPGGDNPTEVFEDLDGAPSIDLFVLDNDVNGPFESDTLSVDQVGATLAGDTIQDLFTTTEGGTVAITGGVAVSYTPRADFFGVDSFVYRLSDGRGGVSFATATVTVTPRNDAPIPSELPLSAFERLSAQDESTDLLVLNGALPGPAGPPAETEGLEVVSIESAPSSGTAVVDATGTYIIYTPDVGNLEGVVDTFDYKIRDEFGAEAIGTAVVTIVPRFRPYAVNDQANVDEDSNALIDVQANDYLNEGAEIVRSFFLVESISGDTINTTLGPLATTNGSVVVEGDQVRYTPNADFFGSDSFQYVIDDDVEGSAPSVGTVFVTVVNVNDPPVANDDVDVPVEEDTATQIFALANDTSGVNENDELFLNEITSQPTNGTVEISADLKHFIYTPKLNYYGSDSFTYTMRDNVDPTQGIVSNEAVVSIVVTNVNDAPTAIPIFEFVAEDAPATLIDVLPLCFPGDLNDRFDGGDTISLVTVGPTDNGGTAVVDGDMIRYQPAADFFGTETFTYTIMDSFGETDQNTVTVNISSVNDDPIVKDEDGTAEDQQILSALKDSTDNMFDVLYNDVGGPFGETGQALTLKELIGEDAGGAEVRGDSVPTKHGMASISADRKMIIYTPTAGFETEAGDFDMIGYVVQDDDVENPGESNGVATVDVLGAVPTDISGYAYIDANNDGVKNPGELALSGVKVTLTGTDLQGVVHNDEVMTDGEGMFVFAGIMPTADGSSYQINADTPRYLMDGLDAIEDTMADEDYTPGQALNDVFTGIELGILGADGRAAGNYSFGERGLAAPYIKLTQYLASTDSGMMLATDGLGETFWFSSLEGWEGVTGVSFEFGSIANGQGMATATMRVTDSAGAVHSRSLSYYKDYDFAGDPRDGGCVVFIKGTAADWGIGGGSDVAAVDGAQQYQDGVDAVFGSGEWA